MKRSILSFRNEDGSTLIIAILILLLGTLIGIFAINTSTIEIQISGNDKSHKIAFYGADSGVYTVPKVMSPIIDVKGDALPLSSVFTFNFDTSGDKLYKKIGINPGANIPHILFDLGNSNHVDVGIEKLRSINLVGGGAEFAAANEGAGGGGLKGIFYGLDSNCTSLQNSRSNVYAQYLKVTGAAGGM
ncbi:MAG: hypothetical protein J7K15_10595 [Deltaproteobacteria bacterium]|nr:hypothetical protein [Deltaproteobacteria bacterium]